MAATIQVEDLQKLFETPAGPLPVLDGISTAVDSGESLAVVGPSGSGKSTFLHIVGTLDQPTSGRVLLLGEDPAAMSESQLADFRNRHLGFVFQEHHLLPQLTALQNVVVPSVPRRRAGNDAAERARALLCRVGLAERLDHRPGHLSGGERQRVAVARALMNEPRILLADEPTGSLDQANAATIGQLLLELQRENRLALICVTHNDELAAQFDRQVRLESGRFVDLAQPARS